jgi:hypothetical protein
MKNKHVIINPKESKIKDKLKWSDIFTGGENFCADEVDITY